MLATPWNWLYGTCDCWSRGRLIENTSFLHFHIAQIHIFKSLLLLLLHWPASPVCAEPSSSISVWWVESQRCGRLWSPRTQSLSPLETLPQFVDCFCVQSLSFLWRLSLQGPRQSGLHLPHFRVFYCLLLSILTVLQWLSHDSPCFCLFARLMAFYKSSKYIFSIVY